MSEREPEYLVCERTGGVVPHAEGSDEILCDRCSHPVSVAPACFNWVSRGVPVVCSQCSETMESTYMRVVPSLSEAHLSGLASTPVLEATARDMLEAARRALPGVPDGTPEHRLLVSTIQTCEQFLAGRSGAGDDVPVV